jgi:hypothetical protein
VFDPWLEDNALLAQAKAFENAIIEIQSDYSKYTKNLQLNAMQYVNYCKDDFRKKLSFIIQ